jgi:hypothetical protein
MIIETMDPPAEHQPVLAYRMPRDTKNVKNSLEEDGDYQGLVAHLRSRRKSSAKEVTIIDITVPEARLQFEHDNDI